MARINLDDILNKDNRFMSLVIAFGDYDKALGHIVRAFQQAQIYWFPDKKPIPFEDWKKQNFSEYLIKCGLAEVTETGFYVCGSEEQFDWLFQKQRAGLASSTARMAKKRQKRSTLLNAVERTSTSISISSSISSSNSTWVPDTPPNGVVPVAPPTISGLAWEAYKSAFREKYQTEPIRNATVNAQILNFIKRVGQDSCCDLIRFFVKHPSKFYEARKHQFGVLLADCEKIHTEWQQSLLPPEEKNYDWEGK